MIGREGIEAILSQYAKYGWTLRSVLLSDDLRNRLGPHGAIFGDAVPKTSDIDAAWFSRPSTSGRIAWELRHLDEFPFALLQTVEQDANETELENIFRKIEDQLRERIRTDALHINVSRDDNMLDNARH